MRSKNFKFYKTGILIFLGIDTLVRSCVPLFTRLPSFRFNSNPSASWKDFCNIFRSLTDRADSPESKSQLNELSLNIFVTEKLLSPDTTVVEYVSYLQYCFRIYIFILLWLYAPVFKNKLLTRLR